MFVRLSAALSRSGFYKFLPAAGLLIFALLLQQLELLKRWDNLLYDAELQLFSRPANSDIVIVAIDDYSLKKLGKWPWPRRIHADLINLLTPVGVKAIGLDIIFAESDQRDPDADRSLVAAVRNNGRIILPVLPELSESDNRLRVTLPWRDLMDASAGLGHVDVDIDNDGVLRSIYLLAGMRGTYWPSFAFALLTLDKPDSRSHLLGARTAETGISDNVWRRDYRIEVPFAGAAGHFRRVSYADILADAELRAGLHGKFIVVGVTAAGLAQRFTTPMSKNTGLITGAEVNANVLDTLLNDLAIQPIQKTWAAIMTGLLVLMPLLAGHFIFPRQILLITLLFSVLTLGSSMALLRGLHYWFGPTPVVLVLALNYLLWIWRRLQFFAHSLFKERQLASATLYAIADAVITTDHKGLIVYINPAAEKLTGYPLEAAQGLPIDSVVRLINSDNEQATDGFLDAIGKLLAGRSIKEIEPRFIINNSGAEYAIQISGNPIRDESGDISGAVLAFSDITDILQISRKISYLATHDPLTGLANRVLFYEQMEKAIASCNRQGNYLAVIFIDLDDFKKVNDGMGHAVGDLLLIEVASRLRMNMRQIDTVARWGGDEFVILLNQLPVQQNITGIIVKILERLSEPFHFEGLTLYVTPSIGISIYPKDGSTYEELLLHADTAMFQVKENGRNNFSFFSSGFDKSVKQRLIMEKEMYSALEEGQFEMYYQPQVDSETHRIVGAEALLRWRHPDKGLIAPDAFIPLAEETGFINQIGDWVLQTVCRQIADWQNQGLPQISVAVNLSPRQFLQSSLCDKIDQALEENHVRADLLKVEITESLMIKNIEKVAKMLWDIRALGVAISIDDFGTGYSSLSVLKNFPIDQLKIDKSFINYLGVNADDANIAQSIILLGHNMRMNVVAEGVETQAQLDLLKHWHCDFIQGYYFSPPLPSAQMMELLRRGAIIGN